MEQALEILSRSNLQVELAAKEKEVGVLNTDMLSGWFESKSSKAGKKVVVGVGLLKSSENERLN